MGSSILKCTVISFRPVLSILGLGVACEFISCELIPRVYALYALPCRLSEKKSAHLMLVSFVNLFLCWICLCVRGFVSMYGVPKCVYVYANPNPTCHPLNRRLGPHHQSETFNPRTKSQKSTSLASTMRIGLQVSHKFISADLHVQREVFFFSVSSGFSNTNDKKHDQRGSGSTLGSLKLPSRDMEHSLPCRQCRALTAARHRIPA